MTTFADVLNAISHVSRCTGDPNAWRVGLDVAQADLNALSQHPETWDSVLDTIRQRHPTLFDPTTRAPVDPGAGAGADAIRIAETALANQNSAVALLDLHVVTAILNAHAVTAEATAALDRLQSDVENAVRTRTDLDTPAGARDFQRYLNGKLREIGAVVESAGVDAVSRAALASAWSALYRAASGTPSGDPTGTRPGTGPTGTGTPGPGTPGSGTPGAGSRGTGGTGIGYGTGDELGEYDGVGLPPYSDDGTGAPTGATVPAAATQAATAPAASIPSSTPIGQSGGTPFGLPTLSMPSGASTEGLGDYPSSGPNRGRDEFPSFDQEPEDDYPDTPGTEDPGAEDPGTEGDDDAPDAEPARVTLPDGDTITVGDKRIAAALTATLAGTPIDDAFRAQGITVPPPDTPVDHPVDPAKLHPGDIAVFTDRIAVALDADRAWFDGQLQPIANVGGPTFLGWWPLGIDETPSPTAEPEQTPTPTRPAA